MPFASIVATNEPPYKNSVRSSLVVLTGKSFSDKEQAITVLASSGQPYVATLFTALDSGNLYYRKSDQQLVVREQSRFIGLQSGAAVEGKSRDFKRVGLNNALREQLAALASGLALSDPDADKREEQKDVSEKSIKGLHILLAEDNELNMEIAEFVLQNEGAEVTKAWNGQEAVELFGNSEPGEFDVILMDIMMPVMNGYEATKMIRSLDREDAKKIPIIAMTANAFTEDRIRAKEAGMDEHVAKPVDVELLMKVIYSGSAMKH